MCMERKVSQLKLTMQSAEEKIAAYESKLEIAERQARDSQQRLQDLVAELNKAMVRSVARLESA